jgi:hypothetical protein
MATRFEARICVPNRAGSSVFLAPEHEKSVSLSERPSHPPSPPFFCRHYSELRADLGRRRDNGARLRIGRRAALPRAEATLVEKRLPLCSDMA